MSRLWNRSLERNFNGYLLFSVAFFGHSENSYGCANDRVTHPFVFTAAIVSSANSEQCR